MRMRKIKFSLFFASSLLLMSFCFFGYGYFKVTRDAATRIQRGAIYRIIASESPVFYDDGRTPIGVFFEKIHRKYIHYEDIPIVFIKALIAAEDGEFFDHSGVDLKAILRAFLANIRAGEVVQGGSTITQQTAKNIFKRERRSYKAKLKELVQAFLLERKYTKEEIFEMYTNQFFVTGYGKGLGIAAQFFFGKEAKDINLVEAAFIAGSVKGPNRYNPFIKKSETERKEAIRRAKLRKDYVLGNMVKMNLITKNDYSEAKNQEVPFREGKITYRLNVILDFIREQLESDYFRVILHDQGVDNFATSGISVYTSVSKEIQEAALRSLRTRLPLMDVKLSGYNVRQPSETYQELLQKRPNNSIDKLPFLSQITQIRPENEDGPLVVSWEQGGGIIDYDGLKPIGDAWLTGRIGRSAVFGKKHISAFLKNFHVGDLVPVQSAVPSNGNGNMKLMLSRIPELEGGIVVMQEGMVKAMVGGFVNYYFNRAVDAKRQLGSIFKPIVYAAALQLKWNSLDPLQNINDIFPFENTCYVPRPDHTPPSEQVSMAWAGAKSENLATVWLLYHLTDHLNMSEFRQVMELVGLGRRPRESYPAYKRRIRDRHGVVVNRKTLMEAAFEESKKEVESDIIFSGHEETLNNLRRLHFNIDSKICKFEGPEERQILRFSFKTLRELNLKMKEHFKKISQLLETFIQNETQGGKENVKALLHNFYRTEGKGLKAKIIYTENAEFQYPAHLFPVTHEWLLKRPTSLAIKEVWVDGLLTSEILDLVQDNMNKNFRRLLSLKKYDPEVLSVIKDFRTLVNLLYVVYLSKEVGISTRLDPVLSFPLGPNSISITEAALAYQTIMTGNVYPLSPGADLTRVPIITKIVDREGEILWEYKPKPKKVLSDRVSRLVTEILRKAMEVGTGRKARDLVQVFDIPIPTFGKTGTANQFTNSSFVGFIPGPNNEKGQLDMQNGYIIAGYVGYDDNRPMKTEHVAIYGASGALPLWIDTANAITKTHNYMKNLQLADLAFNPLSIPLPSNGKFQAVRVSPITGLPVRLPDEDVDSPLLPTILAEVEEWEGTLRLKTRFEPVKGVME